MTPGSFRQKIGILILTVATLVILTSTVFAQEVTERVKIGNAIGSSTYICSGINAGKVAFVDGWNVYLYDLMARTYEKYFSYSPQNFGIPAQGISYISQGEFAGNFIMPVYSPIGGYNSLHIVSPSGTSIAEVRSVGFSWSQSEGITEITSGPYLGKYAMARTDAASYRQRLSIIRIETSGGTSQVFLEKDISVPEYILTISPTFIDSSCPNPSLRNHFALSAANGNDAERPYQVICDDTGQIEGILPAFSIYEGFAYIPEGLYQGQFIASDLWAKDSWIGNWDGTNKTLYTIPGLKIYPYGGLRWLEQTGQLLVIEYPWTPNVKLNLLSRVGPQQWQLDNVHFYSGLNTIRGIEYVPAYGNYFILGSVRIAGKTKYKIHAVNSNFQFLREYVLPEDYQGSAFSFNSINHIPGTPPQDDRFSLSISQRKMFSFDQAFSNPADIMDLSSSVTLILDCYYDAANKRHYLLDNSVFIRVYDASWNLIANFDISSLFPGSFINISKVMSGDLKGNLILVNRRDCELVFINVEYQLAKIQLQKLLNDVRKSGIDKGIMNSLVQKLEGAIDAVNRKNIIAAINKIEAFQNEVQGQSGKKIATGTAQNWLDQATAIITGLQNIL